MLNDNIKQILLEQGADVCAIAGIERFDHVPDGFSPRDLFPQCRAVIVFGLALPRGLTQVEPRLLYAHFNALSCAEADRISFHTAKVIEKAYDCVAVPLPCDSPYEFWESDTLRGRGLLSMKHAAVLSGLGTLGKNTLFLHPVFGNLLTIGALLTDLDLPSDPLCEQLCIPGCTKCLDACPVHAIESGQVNQEACRLYTYGKTARGFDTVDCNRCRTVCPLKYGKNPLCAKKPAL